MPESAFVGRKKHIEQFRKLLNAPKESPYILNLRGQGGIGKTKILQKIIEICNQENIPHTEIIDFYGIEMSSRITAVANKIASSLKNGNNGPFEKYWELRRQFEEKESRATEQELLLQFISSLSEWTEKVAEKGKKGLIVFDTFEAIRYTVVENHVLNEWLPKLGNAVVIISGRQVQGEINFHEEIKNFVQDAPVEKFSREEAIEYLEERKIWEAVQEDKVSDKLFELTDQKPLLLALSADWIANYTVFPSTTPKDLVQNVTQADFERKLVENLPNVIIKPENEFLPYMAHLIRPFDTELIRFLNSDISEKDAEEILNNLNELSFVKKIDEENGPAYWFQDELRHLFHKYVFSDKKWDRIRQDVSKKMLQFHDIKMEQARQKGDILEQQRTIAKRLYHEIYLDPVEGIRKFQELFQDAREKLQYGFASMLMGPVRYTLDHLPERQQYTFELAEGRWMRDMGDPKKAEMRFEELLKKHRDNPEREPFIYNALGVTKLNLGKFHEALDNHNESLKLSKKSGHPERIHIEKQEIAHVYQAMGNWDEAISYFKCAYEAALAQKDMERTAIILSELGYVYGLAGNYDVGIRYSNQGVELLKQLQQPQQLAKARILRANIYRRAGDYEKSLTEIYEVMEKNFFDDLDHQNRSLAYFHRGVARWSKAIATNNDKELADSKKDFEECIKIARRYNLFKELPRFLHQLSHVYEESGMTEESQNTNKEAYDLAVKFHDIYYAVNSLLLKAELDYKKGNYETIAQYANEMKIDFEDKDYNFPLFYGRMDRILGDIAFSEKKYTDAVNLYAEGLEKIARHGGYGRYKTEIELENLEKKLNFLNEETALDFYKGLKKIWIDKDIDKKKPAMIGWADEHITRLTFKIPLHTDNSLAADNQNCYI